MLWEKLQAAIYHLDLKIFAAHLFANLIAKQKAWKTDFNGLKLQLQQQQKFKLF